MYFSINIFVDQYHLIASVSFAEWLQSQNRYHYPGKRSHITSVFVFTAFQRLKKVVEKKNVFSKEKNNIELQYGVRNVKLEVRYAF